MSCREAVILGSNYAPDAHQLGIVSMPRFLMVVDTPGIKEFVFGTDALAEIRGASALLDRLNRVEMEECIQQSVDGNIEEVYANGGSGQFVIEARERSIIYQAVNALGELYRRKTGGEVRPVAGIAEWPVSGIPYHQALQNAFHELRLWRDLGSGRSTVATLPFERECQSCSYLPATGPYSWGGERLLLSTAAQLKREESRQSRRGTLWSGWMEYLDKTGGGFVEAQDDLRTSGVGEIGEKSLRQGYVGLVYADGNAMGQWVQELDSQNVYRAFSTLVDESIREACYRALTEVCSAEIARAREAVEQGDSPGKLPADILLLGGDDLLVLLPADRALSFALIAEREFQEQTRKLQEGLSSDSREFFKSRLQGCGLTISCGVALARASYPFYLMLDLAEELLKSAKKGGSADPDKTDHWAPAYIDFHLITGSASSDLCAIRESDYLVSNQSSHHRTLRPYRRELLESLQAAVHLLREARLPRSKQHDLFEAALEPRPPQAQRRAEELFGRLRQDNRHRERRALWDALSRLGSLSPYPWTERNSQKSTALADLIEAYDLFVQQEEE